MALLPPAKQGYDLSAFSNFVVFVGSRAESSAKEVRMKPIQADDQRIGQAPDKECSADSSYDSDEGSNAFQE